jgi:osmotically-inducible protein OsmY
VLVRLIYLHNLMKSSTMKSDAQIRQDVIAELSWEPSVDAGCIGVEVKDGIVTLEGHVDSFAEKWEAEHAARRISGVKALAIEIEVKLPDTSVRTDADIAASAANFLQWMTYLPREGVQVSVQGGWITLTGQVDWEYQRQAATRGVRALMGVTGVSDQIVIKPAVSLGAVKAVIEAALKRRAQSDAKHIVVEVNGADVTLSGTVQSWSERELARHSAWGTPGVCSVVDNMVVAS